MRTKAEVDAWMNSLGSRVGEGGRSRSRTLGAALISVLAFVAWCNRASGRACESRPRESVTVVYGESGDALRVVFTPSDEGVLRAMDARDGAVLWTYQTNEAAAATGGGSRMTDVRVLRFDARRDGVIDISDGDKVWLYFGVRRAGTAYYALDVTDPSRVGVLWRIGSEELPGAGQSWSTPTIARVRVSGESQNGEHFALVLGGGYDTRTNTSGNRLFIVDAATGHLLWFAGGEIAASAASGSAAGSHKEADLRLPAMRYPIAARVTAVDTDGDAFADRLYAADLGGQVWRFDIWNGRTRGALATGGVFASLGKADFVSARAAALPTGSDARRFFNAPDVALMQLHGAEPYYNIALGSGDAAELDDPAIPASTNVRDSFYSLRDRKAFVALTQAAYDAAAPILDADLVHIAGAPFESRVPSDAVGWKLDLNASGAGERVLSESITANGVTLFTTFQPGAGCPEEGAARVYALKVDTAEAGLDLDDDGQITADDLSVALSEPGIPPAVEIVLTPPANNGSGPIGPQPEPPPARDDEPPRSENTQCRVGTETLAHCVPFTTQVRTFWRRHSTL
jgi:type IV pilus assembly protein PilY1